jgi:hypothetical protein
MEAKKILVVEMMRTSLNSRSAVLIIRWILTGRDLCGECWMAEPLAGWPVPCYSILPEKA